MKPKRVIFALVFQIKFLYKSKVCLFFLERRGSFSGNKPACGVDKHLVSQLEQWCIMGAMSRWVSFLLLGPCTRTQSCQVRLEEGHLCNKARIFRVYRKENVLSCCEERGVHYKFQIHYCHNHVYLHCLLQTAGPTMRKREIKISCFPFFFKKNKKQRSFPEDTHLMLPFTF